MKFLNLLHLCLIASIVSLLGSCGRSPQISYDDKYDLYRVEVRSTLNVRTAPSKTASKMFALDNGAEVYVMDISNGWAHIIYHDREGYVAADYITLSRKANKVEQDVWYSDQGTARHDLTVAESHELEEASYSKLMFVDSAYVLNSEGKQRIADAIINKDQYLVVYTCDSVPVSDIYSVVEDKWEEFEDKPWYSSGDEMILILYSRDQRYISISGKTRAIKHIFTTIPEKYFKVQYDALQQSPCEAILAMEHLLMESIRETDDRIFLANWSLALGDISDDLFSKGLVQNLLPNDNWLYRYIFSWLAYIPMEIAKFFMLVLGSFFPALITMSLLYVLLMLMFYHAINNSKPLIIYNVLLFVFNLLYYSSALCFSVFMDQTMDNILLMQRAGYSQRLIDATLASYLGESFNVTVWFCILFIVVKILEISLKNHILISYSMLPKTMQVNILHTKEYMREEILAKLNKDDNNVSLDDILAQENPMRFILINIIGEPIMKSLIITLPAIFVLSGRWLYFMFIVSATILIYSAGKIIDDYRLFKKRNLI